MIFLNKDDQQDLMHAYGLNVPEVHILGGIGLHLDQYPFSIASSDPIKFLFIGRLLKEKGVFELIEAMRIVKKNYPQAHFTILGAIDHQNMGPLNQDTLNQLIQEKLFELGYSWFPGDMKIQYTDAPFLFMGVDGDELTIKYLNNINFSTSGQ